jgi:hypothetical protein
VDKQVHPVVPLFSSLFWGVKLKVPQLIVIHLTVFHLFFGMAPVVDKFYLSLIVLVKECEL